MLHCLRPSNIVVIKNIGPVLTHRLIFRWLQKIQKNSETRWNWQLAIENCTRLDKQYGLYQKINPDVKADVGGC